MRSVRKITCSNFQSKLSKKTSISLPSFCPQTRVQMIKYQADDFPLSTPTKLIYPSNQYGNGFKSNPCPSQFKHLGIQQMKKQIDIVCYQAWKQHKQVIESTCLDCSQFWIKLLSFIIIIGLITYLTIIQSGIFSITFYYTFALIIVFFAVVIVGISLYIVTRKPNLDNYDDIMVTAIKKKLFELNKNEKEQTNNNKRFEWSCHQNCTWIAVTVFIED